MKTTEELAREYADTKIPASNNGLNESVREIIKDAFTAGRNKTNEWISVEDRLPEKEGEYLCKTTKWEVDDPSHNVVKYVFFEYYKKDSEIITKERVWALDVKREVTHWREI